MPVSQHPAFFPLWVVVTHFPNIFFMLLLARSGLEVLPAFPPDAPEKCAGGRR